LVHFYCLWVYFVAIWYGLWSFGIFFPFWYVVPRKSGNPDSISLTHLTVNFAKSYFLS
jgi:hypothetical protein